MRRLILLASVGLMSIGLGCNHTAGVCDCDTTGYGTPRGELRPLPPPPPPPPPPAPPKKVDISEPGSAPSTIGS